MILKARVVLPMESAPLEHGAVAINDNLIIAVGPAAEVERMDDGPVVDLGEAILLPGLINAHCHLDYSTLRHSIAPPKSFTAWVQRINSIKRSLTDDDYLKAIERGFEELIRWGTTTVCNVESFPELMPRLPPPPIRTWWFYEMIDIRHRITTDDVVRGALSFFQAQTSSFSHYGLSPHAPYTASQEIYELANACAGTMDLALTTHVAESREERAMFCEQRGALFDFLSLLERPMEDCGPDSPFRRLWKSGAITADWLLVHMNELDEEDFALLASLPPERRPTVVHCPGSHAYFSHSPFQFARLAELGVNLCLGTDSLASTHTLSLFDEMRALQENVPSLSGEEILRTVTLHPARALRREGELGVLRVGALADLIALPLTGNLATVYDQVVQHRQPASWMMIDGKIRTP